MKNLEDFSKIMQKDTKSEKFAYFWKTPDKESDLQQEFHRESSTLGTDFRTIFDFLSQTK